MSNNLISAYALADQVFGATTTPDIDMFYDISYKVSTHIVNYRTMHNLTQTKLAEQLGVTQPMVHKLESGDYNFSLETLCSFFAKMNVKVDISLEDNMAKNANGSASDYDAMFSNSKLIGGVA